MSTASVGFSTTGFESRRPAVRSSAPQRAASQPRLRLTQRGRAVLVTVAATPLVIAALLFGLNGGGATASLGGSEVAFQYVTVESGQSLWQLAEQLAPSDDPRDVIQQIVQLNNLSSADVVAGQQLAIPAAYAH